jgi:phosphatidylserine/phosphatidylglycerophosphate/cardiolipin synthase-like enzyme
MDQKADIFANFSNMRSLRMLIFSLVGLSALPVGAAESRFELVETAPIETTLDHPEIREAAVVWPEMIAKAHHTIDVSEFYATSQPGSRLETVIDALSRAAARGVNVRFLVDAAFAKKEPATAARLAALPGVELRRIDWGTYGGGVLHAKYFVIDGTDAYVGSQNFDWRSLTHIQELGVRIHDRDVAAALADVFETDWALAGGAPRTARTHRFAAHLPLALDGARVTPVFSPRGWLPDETQWDLPRLIELIDGARERVRVQLLTYGSTDLEAALLRAAGRGVPVELLVSEWCKRKGCLGAIKQLAAAPHVSVRFLDVPPAKTGFIPYARVAHAKYLVVDGASAWIGTSNWERDYFERSRNVGLVIRGGSLPAQLNRFFEDNWRSPYAERLDRAVEYTAPRVHD